MSANVLWKVTVIKPMETDIEISALTETDAREQALLEPEVLFVKSVRSSFDNAED